jgi:hypothetical protein
LPCPSNPTAAIPLKSEWISGYTTMVGHHMAADSGFLDDAMFRRTHMVYDEAWPSYGTGLGSAARGGTLVAATLYLDR